MIVDKVATDTIPVWKAKIIEKENIKELLDKIRADVEEQVVPRSVYTDKQKKQVLAIIDKYKAESEDKE